MIYLIANWKAAMTYKQAQVWFQQFINIYRQENLDHQLQLKGVQIIICPPYPLIPFAKEQCNEFQMISIGAQHASPHPNGTFTGEVTAEILKDFVDYTLVGHSEMRKYDHLEENEIKEILLRSQEHDIKTVLCVRNENDTLYKTDILAYEPVDAIANGHNAKVEDVLQMKKNLHVDPSTAFIYGGSVDPKNVKDYLKSSEINGFLIGTSSRDPGLFMEIVKTTLS